MNMLDVDLVGLYVILKKEVMKPRYQKTASRVVLVTGGFGSYANTIGSMVICEHIVDGDTCKFPSPILYRFASDKEVFEAYKLRKEFIVSENIEFKSQLKTIKKTPSSYLMIRLFQELWREDKI